MPVRDFNGFPAMIRRLRPALANAAEDAAKETHEQVIRNWERGADAQGNAWAPLHPRTIAEKGHSDPLIDTQEMIDSTDYEVDKRNLTAAVYVEDMPKITYHEFGTERIPRRPVLGPAHPILVNNTEEEVKQAIHKSANRSLMAGAGAGAIIGGLR